MGATSWEVQDAELSMEELYQSEWCTEALCFHGHGIAWMYSVRNSGSCFCNSTVPVCTHSFMNSLNHWHLHTCANSSQVYQ